MNESTLKYLLKEYEQKRNFELSILDKRVQELYDSNNELSNIQSRIDSLAIKTGQLILSSNEDNYSIINDLQKNLDELKKERKKILDSLNIDESFFKPKFECIDCEDTGYVYDGTKSHLCSCIKQKMFDIEYNKSNIADLRNHNFKKFDFNLYSDKIDEEKFSSNLSPRDNIHNIYNIALSFINNFEKNDEKNLLFTGNTGLGKTFLSNCIANELLKQGKTVLYQTAPVMLDTIIDYRFNKTDSSNIYDNILDVDLLIIDDLGTEFMNSMRFSELFNVINTRLLNQNNHITKTIISTNLNLKDLSTKYDERIFSRFVGYYNICRFFGDDIRFKKH